MEKINVMVFNVGEKPTMKTINNEAKDLNEIVGGYIEMVRIPNQLELVLICNEEGKLLNLPPQLQFGNDVICGNFLIARDKMNGEITSLTENDKLFLQDNWGFKL